MKPETIAAFIGATTGVTALLWRVRDIYARYLHIDLRVERLDGSFLGAVTVVENRGLTDKSLDNAVILVGPEAEDPRETMAALGIRAPHTNAIAAWRLNGTVCGPQGRRLVPVPFYYSENVAIADERISYRVPIPTDGVMTGVPYSVRFFVNAPKRLHRSTHDSFVLSN